MAQVSYTQTIDSRRRMDWKRSRLRSSIRVSLSRVIQGHAIKMCMIIFLRSVSRMSSGIVRAHIAAVLEDEEFSLGTPRMKLALSTAMELLKLCASSEQAIDQFDTFAATLIKKIQPAGELKNSRKRRKLWSNYHSLRCGELGILWDKLYTDLGMGQECAADCLLQQYVNDKLFEGIIESKAGSEETASNESDLNTDECKALRYVAGYVPFRLIRKFQKSSHPLKGEFLCCLQKMNTSDEEGAESFLDYTKRWIKAIDRGGLFTVSDDVYIHSLRALKSKLDGT